MDEMDVIRLYQMGVSRKEIAKSLKRGNHCAESPPLGAKKYTLVRQASRREISYTDRFRVPGDCKYHSRGQENPCNVLFWMDAERAAQNARKIKTPPGISNSRGVFLIFWRCPQIIYTFQPGIHVSVPSVIFIVGIHFIQHPPLGWGGISLS